MRFPSGERFAEAQMRIANTLLDILSCFEPKDVIICVSHADPIKLAVAYFIGLPLDMFQRLSVSPASITILALGESGGRLVALNAQADFDFEP
jgi:probable phosphoglycerate mutase